MTDVRRFSASLPKCNTSSSLTFSLKELKSKGKLKEAQELFEKYKAEADNYSLTTMVSIFGISGNLEKALATFKVIKNPGVISYNAILQYCWKLNRQDVAWDLYKEMKQRQVTPDKLTMSLLQNLFDTKQSQQHWIEVQQDLSYSRSKYLPIALFYLNQEKIQVTNGRGWFPQEHDLVNEKLDQYILIVK